MQQFKGRAVFNLNMALAYPTCCYMQGAQMNNEMSEMEELINRTLPYINTKGYENNIMTILNRFLGETHVSIAIFCRCILNVLGSFLYVNIVCV